jgi:hypothetical protein
VQNDRIIVGVLISRDLEESYGIFLKKTWTLICQNIQFNPLTPNDIHIYIYMSYRTANLQTLHFIYLVNALNILNMLHILRFFLFKMPFVS